ncbi:hypothetical protein LTR27_012196 [Elasticomyces elasticus]|nr:hypothetical protein LTR27_012196 [Elasticomyces elasticus]
MAAEGHYEMYDADKIGSSAVISAHPSTPGPSASAPLIGKLDRYLKTIPTIAFSILLVCSWEATAGGFQAGLFNGGPAALVWGFAVAGPGTLMIVLSLAEMASITPSVGAQYRWTAIYCPRFLDKRFWSFLQGWLTVFAWIASSTIPPFFCGSQINGLIILNYSNYIYKGWHTTLLAYAVILLPLLCNIFARWILKMIEIVGAILHFVFFVVLVVVLITLGGRNSARYVFTADSGGVSGWESPPVAWCIGLLSAVFPLTAFDGVLHLSDEVKNPEIRVPKALITSYCVNAVVAFGFMIVLLFFMGDPEEALSTATGWPIIQICYQAGRTLPAANTLMAIVIIPSIIGYFNSLASVSRLTWAFARDDGLPFSEYFKVVHPKLRIPTRALALTSTASMLLLLIPIGSAVAFNAIVSLATVGLYFSYLMPCLFAFMQRLNGETIAHSAYSWGRWGVVLNGSASVYAIFVIVWICFPTTLPVVAANMNYSGPIMGFVIIFALVDWTFRGRHKFAVPLDKEAVY